MCDVDGCGSLRPGIQERGRLPRSRGIGGTGESFKGEHGLRVARGFISVLNAAKDDDRERVCSGVSILTITGRASGRLPESSGRGEREQRIQEIADDSGTPGPDQHPTRPFVFFTGDARREPTSHNSTAINKEPKLRSPRRLPRHDPRLLRVRDATATL